MQSLSLIIKLVTHLFKQVAKFALVLGMLLVLVTTSPLVVQAQTNSDDSNRVLSNIFPACKFADTGLTSFLECTSQITSFILVIAIIYAFLRLAYMATSSLVFAGGVTSDFYQMIRDSLRNLVVGIVFVGMPVAILTAIDPLAKVLSFRFLEELNLGPEARLREVAIKSRQGCNDFMFCIQTCRTQAPDKVTCVQTCKNKHAKCDSCFRFIGAEGEILDKQGFENCINPPGGEKGFSESGGSQSSGSGGNLTGGTILGCGNNAPITDSQNGFVRLAYTPYFSQNRRPDGGELPPDSYRNNGCGAASSVMIVEMARPGTFPCLESEKLPNYTGNQDHYCLHTYLRENKNYDAVFRNNPQKRSEFLQKTNRDCQGALGVTSLTRCNQSYHAGRTNFLKIFNLERETVSGDYLTAIKNNINQGLPLYLSINFSGGGSHIMVIVGYNEQTKQILINDPWQYDNRWGSSRLMVVTLKNNSRISGYRYSQAREVDIGYIEKVKKSANFTPVDCGNI